MGRHRSYVKLGRDRDSLTDCAPLTATTFALALVWSFCGALETGLGAFPTALAVKSLPASAGGPCSIPGWGDALEEDMTTHSSVLAWRIPWTVEPGGLQSIGYHRVGHD